jgi:uncharacterized membrane protein
MVKDNRMTSHSYYSSPLTGWLQALPLWWRHALADVRGTRRVLPPRSLARIEARVTQGERRHTGQVRVCVETHLPRSYLWRFVRQGASLPQLIEQRALMLFAKLRVWDTERNNGVLIYVLLAERAIHVVADRGLNASVATQAWTSVLAPMQRAFVQGDFELGLMQAVDAVSEVIALNFPVPLGDAAMSQAHDLQASHHARADAMSDAPVIL